MADTPITLEDLTNIPIGKTGIKDLPELDPNHPDWSENNDDIDEEND